jgi:hypothetical protein
MMGFTSCSAHPTLANKMVLGVGKDSNKKLTDRQYFVVFTNPWFSKHLNAASESQFFQQLRDTIAERV